MLDKSVVPHAGGDGGDSDNNDDHDNSDLMSVDSVCQETLYWQLCNKI
jgi:hypothetical protein